MIIGLTGKKGSGKDTVGSYLVEQHGFVRVSFAEPLKSSVAALFDLPVKQIEKWKNDPHAVVALGLKVEDGWILGDEMAFRAFLQRYGTEAHREQFGDDFWVEQGKRAIRDAKSLGAAGIVVTDVRFDNEADAIRSMGGSIVRVFRPEAERGDDSHASEQLPQADFALVNTGTFEYLYDQARRYIVEQEPINGPCENEPYEPSDPWALCTGFGRSEDASE